MHPIRAVFLKEFLDGRRDKRAIVSAFLFPIMAPMLVYFLLTAIIELQTDESQLVVELVGQKHAPDLVRWLRERDVDIKAFEGDAKQAVKDKEVEFVVIIPENYGARMAELKGIHVRLINDGARSDARTNVRRVQSLLNAYNKELASLRLIARGVAPEIIGVISIDSVDVASKQERTAVALNFIPLYIIMAAFVSGMGFAMDATAGERERKTLEPLILNPVARHHVVIGKWLAASLFASVGMILTLVLCLQTMRFIPLDRIGMSMDASVGQMLLMIIGMLPLAFLATSLQLFLGIFAKSFKDAQSYIGLLMMLPMAPMMYTMFNPLLSETWMFLVPVLGQHFLLVDVLAGKTLPLLAYLFSALGGLILGLAFVLITAKLFQRESIINQ